MHATTNRQHTAYRILISAILIALVVGWGGFGTAGRALAGGPVSPRDMMNAYYSAINARDYLTAYNQWTAPLQSYADFVAGYATTAHVQAFFGGFQPGASGTAEGMIPAFLVGAHYDGTQEFYQGCYALAYNPAESGMRSWLITGAEVQRVPALPPGFNPAQVLDFDCLNRRNADGSYNGVHAMLSDYYSAINARDYTHAYGLWAPPLQTYEQFVVGFADTREVVMFYGLYQWGGNPYAQEMGRVPVVLLGYHLDGNVVGFQGCLRVSYNPNTMTRWGLLGADLSPLAFTPPDLLALYTSLNQSCYGF